MQRTAKEFESDLKILNATEAVNERQKSVLLDKIAARFGHDLPGKGFAI